VAKDAPPSLSQLAYLGPAGTFTEQALLTQPDLAALDHVLASSISDVLRRVSTGEALLGFVAIENSIEGSVNITQDTLTFEADLLIQREVVIPVQLNLLVPSGTSLSDVQRVVSFPHAIAQCRGWLREHLPDAAIDASLKPLMGKYLGSLNSRLRDAGFEVIYTGIRQTPDMIAEAALQEDVDVVGLSILSGAHMALAPRVMEKLKELGMGDVVVLVGGIIPDEDANTLLDMGVAGVFGPGTLTSEIVETIENSLGRQPV